MFQNTTIPSAILILNKEKPGDRKEKIQFINADDETFYSELSNQVQLHDNGIDDITEIFKEGKTIERRSRMVDHSEVIENDVNLNIALYVDTTEPTPDIDVAAELKDLRELEAQYDELNEQFSEYMQQLNYE